MKKMKDSRTSSIVLHNLLIAVLAFIWLIPIIWLLCTSFSSYPGMNTSTFFSSEMEPYSVPEAVPSGFRGTVPTVVSEYLYHRMLYLCYIYYVRTYGSICHFCYAV